MLLKYIIIKIVFFYRLQWLGYSLCRSWIRCATAGKYLFTLSVFVFFQTASQRYLLSTLESKNYNVPKDISSRFM